MKKLFQNSLLLFLIQILIINYTFCQDIQFNKVLPDVGANFSPVTDITQDSNGYIWFTTKKGLFKYDGNNLTNYANTPTDPNSISGNILLCLTIDNNGIIWTGGLSTGLIRFDPVTEKFTHFMPDTNDPSSILNDTINDILEDHDGKIWVATQQGLDRFDESIKSFIHYRSDRNNPSTISDRQVRVLYEDRQGTLWVGTGSPFPNNGGTPMDGGLDRYNRESDNFTRYEHIPGNDQSLISNKIGSLYEDRDGNFGVGTAHTGLNQMNRENGTFKRIVYDPKNPEKFSVPPYEETPEYLDIFQFITQDTLGNYWLGTLRQGLFYYNVKEEKMYRFPDPDSKQNVFTDLRPRAAYTSRDGILWIGSNEGNLYRINVVSKKIPHKSISTAPVTSLFEEKDGTFWIGTRHDLKMIDHITGDTSSFNEEINFLPDVNDGTYAINQMNQDRLGKLWITGASGLYRWNPDTQTFTGYQYNPNNEYGINSEILLGSLEDSKNRFWIATFKGLNLMDRTTGTFKHFWINKADTISKWNENIISSVCEDRNGNLWTGSWNGGGVNLFNPETETFKNYLPRLTIVCIYEDSNSALWVGTRTGLYRYNKNIDNFIRFDDYGSTAGLMDIFSIIEDNQKNLWIATDDEILRLNPTRNETSYYGQNLGVDDLNRFAILKGNNGDLYFGSNTGYYQINPVDFIKNLPSPKIVVTGFRVADQLIHAGKNGPLKQKLQETKEIRLRYDQNVFSFDFTIIDYNNPQENRLLYYLENYDEDWIQSNSARRAYYFNVPPGKYVLHVKGSNSYGGWAEKTIDILIMPPWYRTWPAYIIYALLVIVMGFAFDRFMRKRIIRKERLKTQERELAQAREIEKAYKELKDTQSQLIQSEKMASLGELTAGIAHEIQNPLNFVNNFSEVNSELIDELEEEIDNGNIEEVKAIAKDIKGNEAKIIHHGKRAESIVKSMLLHSRGSSGHKELTDINALADEYLRLSFHGFRAKDKSFNADFKMEADESLPKVSVVPQDIGRVLLNLINNAFYAVAEKAKQSGEEYEPLVTVTTKLLEDKVEVRVEDNGDGIPDSVKEKIFQPFFTTKPTGQGTGLGLSLSYDIVKAHGGELKVKTKEGEGTEFIIKLNI